MKRKLCVVFWLVCILCGTAHAQEIEAKLSGHSTLQAFTVKDDNGKTLMSVRGNGNVGLGTSAPDFQLRLNEGGILATGGYNTGITVPTIPSGAGFLWYPKRGALRSGYQEPAYVTDTEIGTTSIGCGFKPQASGSASVALGYQPKATGDYSTAIGVSAEASGRGAMAFGTGVEASGDYSTAMGRYTSTNGKEGTFMIGDLNASTVMDASTTNRFYARFENGYVLYTKSDRSTGVYAFRGATSWSSVSDSMRKENFLGTDGDVFLRRFRDLRLGSWNYIGDDQRHYGPMAQEWFAAFGRDGIGAIGNDTTLASADVDGVLCIAVQALAKRTGELRTAVTALQEAQVEIAQMKEQLSTLRTELADVRRNDERIDTLERIVRSLEEDSPKVRHAAYSEMAKEDAE